MRRICVFVHYNKANFIPHYVQLYVNELALHFDEVRLLTNKRDISEKPSLNSNVSIQYEKNEGYDFGLFYKFFKTIDPSDFEQIAIVNDSNILLQTLDAVFAWSKNVKVDFWGLIDSYEKPWFSTNADNYHVQSHFLVLNKPAVLLLSEYFLQVDIAGIFNEKDPKQLRRMVIDKWEIGFSQFLINKKLSCATFIDSKSFLVTHHRKDKNLTHTAYAELLNSVYPLIKKKVLSSSWRKWFGIQEPWSKHVTSNLNPAWDIHAILRF